MTLGERATRLLWERFCHRTDDYAVQWPSGHYTRAEAPLTEELLRRHVAGEITVGAYQVRGDTVRWLCLDLDGDYGNPETCREAVRALAATARRRGLAPLAEVSGGKGWHVWLLTAEISAVLAIQVAAGLLAAAGPAAREGPHQVEIFPKQTETGPEKPFGNLVKLPFGIHRGSGVRSQLVHPETLQPLPGEEQVELLAAIAPHTEAQLAAVVREWGDVGQAPRKPSAPGRATGADGGPILSGTRNATLTSFAGTMRRRGMIEREIAAALLAINARCEPPLSEAEVRKIAWSIGRKHPHETGWDVGAIPDRLTTIEPLRKVLTEPPRWVVTVREQPLELIHADLIEFRRFKSICIAKLNYVPLFASATDDAGHKLTQQATWEKVFLAPALARLDPGRAYEAAPDDAGERGATWHDVLAFINDRPHGETLRELDTRALVRVNGHILFRGRTLREWLKRHGAHLLPADELWSVVRTHGGKPVSVRTAGGVLKAWRVPVPAELDRHHAAVTETAEETEI